MDQSWVPSTCPLHPSRESERVHSPSRPGIVGQWKNSSRFSWVLCLSNFPDVATRSQAGSRSQTGASAALAVLARLK